MELIRKYRDANIRCIGTFSELPPFGNAGDVCIKECDQTTWIHTGETWMNIDLVERSPVELYHTPTKKVLSICECCGAPLPGDTCEYCGSTYRRIRC